MKENPGLLCPLAPRTLTNTSTIFLYVSIRSSTAEPYPTENAPLLNLNLSPQVLGAD